jgi:hypothetical protein
MPRCRPRFVTLGASVFDLVIGASGTLADALDETDSLTPRVPIVVGNGVYERDEPFLRVVDVTAARRAASMICAMSVERSGSVTHASVHELVDVVTTYAATGFVALRAAAGTLPEAAGRVLHELRGRTLLSACIVLHASARADTLEQISAAQQVLHDEHTEVRYVIRNARSLHSTRPSVELFAAVGPVALPAVAR